MGDIDYAISSGTRARCSKCCRNISNISSDSISHAFIRAFMFCLDAGSGIGNRVYALFGNSFVAARRKRALVQFR